MPKKYWDSERDVKILEAVDPSLAGLPLAPQKNDQKQWFISIKGKKVEHDNPSDSYNTVLKMAKKRAMVDGVITTTACSDIFDQDIDEMVENDLAAGVQPDYSSKEPEVVSEPKQEAQADTAIVSTEQLDRIGKTAERVGWTMPELSKYIKDTFKKKSTLMTVAEANQLLNAMEPSIIPDN